MQRTIEPHQRFARWREFRGLTLQQVGETVGMTKQGIGLIELGLRDIKVGHLRTICAKAFKIDLETFFGPLPKIPEAA